MADEQKKIKELEDRIRKLEMMFSKLASKVEYHDREKQRLKTDINHIASVLRRQ
jgi:hypothetical protein